MTERYACASRYAWRTYKNEVVILDTVSGDYFLLNETASLIWEGLLSQQGPQEICQRMVQKYKVTEEKALQDLKQLIQRLGGDGFLVEDRQEEGKSCSTPKS
jgi:hypothetical protein